MRRKHFLLSLLLLLVGVVTANAQTVGAAISDEVVPEGLYYIKSTVTVDGMANPYITANGSALNLTATPDIYSLWQIRYNGDGEDGKKKIFITSVPTGKNWTNGGSVPLGNQRWYSIVKNGDNANYTIQGHADEGNITNKNPVTATNATTFSRTAATEGAACYWEFLPVTLESTYQLSTDEETHYYAIRSRRHSDWMTISEATRMDSRPEQLKHSTPASFYTEALWYFTAGTAEGSVHIYNISGGLPLNSNHIEGQAQNYYIVASPFEGNTHRVTISKNANGTSECMDSQGSNGVGQWGHSQEDQEGTSWELYPMNVDETSMTATCTAEANDLLSKYAGHIGVIGGATQSAMDNLQAAVDATTPQAVYLRNLLQAIGAFKSSIIKPQNGTLYKLCNKNRGNYMNADGANIKCVASDNTDWESVWSWTENPDGTFHIKNEGTSTYVAETPTTWSAGFTLSETAGGQYMLFKKENPGSLTFGGIATYRQMHEDASHNVVTWEVGADATWWNVEEAELATLAKAKINAVDNADASNWELGYVGALNPSDAALAEKNAALKETLSQNNYDNLLAAFESARKPVSEDKYYRIAFKRGNSVIGNYSAVANANGYIGDDADPRHVFTDQNSTSLSAIWQFKSHADGGYNILNTNARYAAEGVADGGYGWGRCIDGTGNAVNLSMTKAAYQGRYIVEDADALHEKLIVDAVVTGTNKYLNCFYNPGNNSSQEIGLWKDGASDAGNVVTIQEVDDVALTVSEVKWASVNYPFAVEIPEGLTAYYATSINSDNNLMIKEIEDGIIPANTPVLIEAVEAKDYAMVITSEAGTPVENNLLKGTTVKRSGWSAEGYYALINDGGTAAFGRSAETLDVVPANKAFIPASNVTLNPEAAPSMLRLFVDGAITDIEGVQVNQKNAADEVYYDLNGCRVLYPTTGIYVTASGKKVFIK